MRPSLVETSIVSPMPRKPEAGPHIMTAAMSTTARRMSMTTAFVFVSFLVYIHFT